MTSQNQMQASQSSVGDFIGRAVRHLWSGDRELRRAFPDTALQHVEEAVAASERRHRAELRVVIEGGLGRDVVRAASADAEAPSLSRARAIELFAQLGVWDTAENSGVLVYILMAEHQLEIVADRGIHAKVGEAVWQDIVAATTARFRQGEYEQGLLQAIEAISEQLQRHFPAVADDANELPDRPLVL